MGDRLAVRRRTTPQQREPRKPKALHDLPSTMLGNDRLSIVRVKIGKRYAYEVRFIYRGKRAISAYRHKRFGPAKHAFDRRVRKFAINAALEALGL